MEAFLLKNNAQLWNNGEIDMLNRTKKTRAAKNWHSKAMLVDPRKTKLTIISSEPYSLIETACNLGEMDVSVMVDTETSNVDDFDENLGTPDEIPGTAVSFVLVDV